MPDRQSSKPFLPVNPGRVSLPLPLPSLRLSRPEVPPEKISPLKMLKNRWFFQCFRVWVPQDPSRTLQGSPRTPQGPPRAPPGTSKAPLKQPPRPQKDPQCPPKNLQMLKTQQKPMVFQCFHKPPNGSIRATQAPPGIPKDTPSTP